MMSTSQQVSFKTKYVCAHDDGPKEVCAWVVCSGTIISTNSVLQDNA